MSGRVASPRFVGRAEERGTLDDALRRMRSGAGVAVLLGGEAGIGKSRLLGDFTAAARSDGVTVVLGECLPVGDVELPYAPIIAALRSLMRERGAATIESPGGKAPPELVRLLPELGAPADAASDDASASQARLFDYVLGVIVNAARESPIVLIVEDIHWSDRSTRDFLAFLVRGTRRERVMLVVTYRSDEMARRHPARPFVLELERSGRATRVNLVPFTRAEVREQVAAIDGRDPGSALVDRLLSRAEGNPFLTEELLAGADDPAEGLPVPLSDALLLRVDERPPAVRQTLEVAAVAGREVGHALLETVSDLDPDALALALRDAVDESLMVAGRASATYRFRHALLREAVYDDLLPGRRRALHLALAEALEANPQLASTGSARSAELAYHWHAAQRLPEAFRASIEAGTEARQVHAHGEALAQYERALELWEDTGGAQAPLPRYEVLRRAAESAGLSGDAERSIQLARDVIDECTDPTQTAKAHERLGRYLWTGGRGEDALPEYRRAAELMPAEPLAPDRAHVLASYAQVLMLCGQIDESVALCEEALVIARQVGSPLAEARVLNTMCANESGAGNPSAGLEAALRALAIAREHGLVEEVGRSYINGGDAIDQAGRLEEAIAFAREGIAVCAALGAEGLFGAFLRGEIGARLTRLGLWGEAAETLEEIIERDPSGITAGNAYVELVQLYADRGDLDLATRTVALAEPLIARSGGSMWSAPAAEGRATIALWSGEPEAARRIVGETLDALVGVEGAFATVRLYELGVRAASDVAEKGGPSAAPARAEADALLGRLGERGWGAGDARPRVVASSATALAEHSRLQTPPPSAPWCDAVAAWEACGQPYQAAYARWRLAEAIVISGGNRRDAASHARDALTVAQRLGAKPLCDAIHALARRARLDVGDDQVDPGSADPRHLDLTPRELEVLSLLGEGMTNREIGAELFMSDKTASVHVSRILTKLEVPNRTAAAATAQRLGVTRTAG